GGGAGGRRRGGAGRGGAGGGPRPPARRSRAPRARGALRGSAARGRGGARAARRRRARGGARARAPRPRPAPRARAPPGATGRHAASLASSPRARGGRSDPGERAAPPARARGEPGPSMETFRYFTRAYPWQSVTVLVCLMIAGLMEGVGLGAVVPLLGVVLHGEGAPPNGFEAKVGAAFHRVGLDPTFDVLVAFVCIVFPVKALLVLFSNRHVGYMVARVATDLRLGLVRSL